MTDYKLKWKKLLDGTRLRDGVVKDRTKENPHDLRNDFDDDYSRLIFSPAVRRLQDKTQVFPLEKSDYVRTRLTHSLEVSSIGRSIGVSVEQNLIKESKLDESDKGKISALLAVIGLVHDLGNPPYGHFGEAAIQRFFKYWFQNSEVGKDISKEIGEEKTEDLRNFEGNAQTFRLLTKLHNLRDEFGYNLSAATLASIIKYPRSSVEGNKDNESNKGVSYKKFGYLQSEKERFKLVQKYTGIGDYRHPVTFLLEAADDIAYLAGDIEDGCRMKILNYEQIKTILGKHISRGTKDEQAILKHFQDTYNNNLNKGISNALDNAIQQLRINAQGLMISSVVDAFLHLHDNIVNGEFDDELLKVSKAKNIVKAFKDLSYQIFNDKNILATEFSGGQVVNGLLELFVNAVISDKHKKPGTHEHKLYCIISDSYKDIMNDIAELEYRDIDIYDRLLLVTDYICGMTDSFALDLYRKLNGIKL